MRSHRTSWAPFAAALGAAALCCTPAPTPAPEETPGPTLPAAMEQLRAALPERPGANVIVISFDALRADVLGAYGHPRPTSPAIDAFAEQSLIFDRAYTVAPVTPTSFAAAFSGMLPTRVFHAWSFVAEESIGSYFSEAGYHSAALVNSVQLTPERGFDRGFDEYLWRRNDPDDEFVDTAIAWLDEERQGPFFAWIHFLMPHAPYDYREMARHFYDESYSGPFEKTSGVKFEADDPADIARIRSLYEGQVLFTDGIFGKLLGAIEERGLLETSIVVLTADHGEEFYERGGFQHGKLTEEHVRVPLIVYHPDGARGARTDVLYTNVDLLPTLLGVVGHPTRDPLDGRNLVALDHEPTLALGVSMTGAHDRYLSLRRGSEKLILTCMPEADVDLYDLGEDPGETVDLSEERRGVTRALDDELGKILGGDPCGIMQQAVRGALQTRGLDAESVKALEALGYL